MEAGRNEVGAAGRSDLWERARGCRGGTEWSVGRMLDWKRSVVSANGGSAEWSLRNVVKGRRHKWPLGTSRGSAEGHRMELCGMLDWKSSNGSSEGRRVTKGDEGRSSSGSIGSSDSGVCGGSEGCGLFHAAKVQHIGGRGKDNGGGQKKVAMASNEGFFTASNVGDC